MDILCPSLMVIAPALAVEPNARDRTSVSKELTQCSVCSALKEEQWSHLREGFAKRSAYRQKTGLHGDSFVELEIGELEITSEDFSQVDDTLLDLEPEDTGISAPLTGISPLTSLPAPLPAQNVPATFFTMGAVPQPMPDSSAAPHVSDSHTEQSSSRKCTSHNSW